MKKYVTQNTNGKSMQNRGSTKASLFKSWPSELRVSVSLRTQRASPFAPPATATQLPNLSKLAQSFFLISRNSF